ncbi:MAG: exodeoxyribonuclease V subunit gamma, partial [Nitrospiraceae bacterium]|nr:exodeoxyribonuclease V subunit gamma [Nitrospiraceae bacterium]
MLYLYESQRLEVLADLFVDRMTGWAREGRLDPLRPEILIPQNPVIGRWLAYRISGQTGVSA